MFLDLDCSSRKTAILHLLVSFHLYVSEVYIPALMTSSLYLLTPMNRATLLHVKSTILHCPPGIITRQRASIDSKLLREMSVITTYLNDNSQTPLIRFDDGILYNQLCNKYSDKSNRWSLFLSLSVA